MADANSTFLHQWFEEAWNQGREDAIDRMLAPVAVGDGLRHHEGTAVTDTSGFKQFYRALRKAIPDPHIQAVDTVAEGDKLAGRCRCRGTHTGEGLGLAPTGRKVDFNGIVFERLGDGKIVESWDHFDFEGMRAQIADAISSD